MSLMAPTSRHCADQATPVGLRRSVRLFRLFLAEQSDPEKFYSSLAEDAVQQGAEHAELSFRTAAPVGGVVADGYWLPVRDGTADVVFSSNVLEHVPDPMGLIEEMIRATRPGGLVYLSYTNWYSPWGGHEMSPWHYLGPRYAERRYIRRNQRKPKHEVGANLFRVHVGPVLRALRARPDIEIVAARPRYYPRWCRLLLRLPGLREVATWNLMLIMRRVG